MRRTMSSSRLRIPILSFAGVVLYFSGYSFVVPVREFATKKLPSSDVATLKKAPASPPFRLMPIEDCGIPASELEFSSLAVWEWES